MGFVEELNNIDMNDISSWSRRVKIFMTCLLGVGLIAAGYYFVIKQKIVDLDAVKARETSLRATFLEKKELAVNLDAYKAQLAKLEITFNVLTRQLPNESEIPDLLTDMTQVGLSRGLRFEQIRPGNTVPQDFYAEKLVNVKVNGDYHQIAGFISDIAALPRIINVANFKLTRNKDDDQNNLTLEAVTKTYHYLDSSYVAQ